MPNWTQNTLNIILPNECVDSFKQALTGPSDWTAPRTPRDDMYLFHRQAEPSAHQSIQLESFLNADPEDLKSQFIAENRQGLEWMPVSYEDIQNWAKIKLGHKKDDDDGVTTVPLSITALSPWENKEEFEKFFPGKINAQGWWEIETQDQKQYDMGGKGYIALHNYKMGVKWAPGQIVCDEDCEAKEGHTLLVYEFQTPWAPMDKFQKIFEKVLTSHKAKALLYWEEEDSNSGWFYSDPMSSSYEEENYEHGKYNIETIDSDYPDEPMWDWDHVSFLSAVLSDVDDEDFTALLS
jgi:hypothetical protein